MIIKDNAELTKEEFIDLVYYPKIESMTPKELILNYNKLLLHTQYCSYYEREQEGIIADQEEKISVLEYLLEKNNVEYSLEGLIDTYDDFDGYLREGYKVRMPVGTIEIEDKEGNREVIARTDGNGWRENPPPTRIHEVMGRDNKHLIVSVTEEQKDGSYIEIDRYKISS